MVASTCNRAMVANVCKSLQSLESSGPGQVAQSFLVWKESFLRAVAESQGKRCAAPCPAVLIDTHSGPAGAEGDGMEWGFLLP